MTKIRDYKYNVILPDASLYGQFKNLSDPNILLNALLNMGFDDVFEVSRASEILSFFVQDFKEKRKELAMPRISCACPTILKLIAMRFPDLIPNVACTVTPMQLAAIIARREAAEKTGYDPNEIGIFCIVPCPAQIADAYQPLILDKPVFNGAFAIKDIYPLLLDALNDVDPHDCRQLTSSGEKGISWSYISGESHAQKETSYLAVDGVSNCIEMLEAIDAGRIDEADYIELAACPQGCVGGVLTAENPYTASLRIRRMCKNMAPHNKNNTNFEKYKDDIIAAKSLSYMPVFLLDDDRKKAMEKMAAIDELAAKLPRLDCGSCGSPSCRALAEDIVMGKATINNCIFRRNRGNHDSK